MAADRRGLVLPDTKPLYSFPENIAHRLKTAGVVEAFVRAGPEMKKFRLTALVLIANLLPAPSTFSGPAPVQMETHELQTLVTMPLSYVIETALMPQIGRLRRAEDKSAEIAKIAVFGPEMRNLFWLSFLRHEIGHGEMHLFFTRAAEGRKIRAGAARLLAEQGHAASGSLMEEREDRTDPLRHADNVLAALSEAGLTRQAEMFSKARERASTDPFGDFSAWDSAFGSRGDLQAAIDAYVTRTPVLMAWAGTARAGISDEDRLYWLTGRLYALEERIDSLPKAMKQILVTHDFNAEMLNGGMHQFFSNPSGRHAPDVVTALADIGLPGHADAVQRGIDMFGKPYPVDTQERHRRHFSKEWGEWDDLLSELTYDVDDGEITPALIALAKRENILPR